MAVYSSIGVVTGDVDLGSSAGVLQNIAGLSMAVQAGQTVHFSFAIHCTTGTNIGTRFGVNGPSGTIAVGTQQPNAAAAASYASITALNTVIFAETAGSNAVQRTSRIAGVYTATAAGTLQFQACNEGSGNMTLFADSVGTFDYGAFVVETDGSIASTATLTGTTAHVLPSVGSMTVAATLSGEAEDIGGPDIVEATGTIVAAATLTGAGAAVWRSTGSMAAAATVTGATAAVWAATSTIPAVAVFSGQAEDAGGPTTVEADGTIVAAATFTGVSGATWLSAGDIQALAALEGVGAAVWASTATIPAVATLTGQTAATWGTVGTIAAVATLTGQAEDAAAPVAPSDPGVGRRRRQWPRLTYIRGGGRR